MSLGVRRLDDADAARYEAFLAPRRERMIYYDWRFRRFLVDLLGCEAHYLGAFDSAGDLAGVFPLMARDGALGRVYNSLPFFGSNGGPIGSAAAAGALWSALADLADSAGTAAATVVSHPFHPAIPPYPPDYEDSRIGQFTALDAGADPSFPSRIDSSARRNVAVAARAGVVVAIENGELGALEDIHRENILAIGGAIKPPDFFRKLGSHFRAGTDWRLYVARRGAGGEIVGALLLFYSGKIVDYYIPGTRLAARALQPSAALIHTAMTDASSSGYSTWNWGGTWPSQEGVMRFKRKWAAVDRPYRYWVKLRNRRILSTDRRTLLAMYPNFYVVPFGVLT